MVESIKPRQGVTVHTHEGVKGHNDKKAINFVSVLAYPHQNEIQRYLLSVGIDDNNKKDGDESSAISTLISNRFNQTIGRNTGYRNEFDSKHIALIPQGLAKQIKSDVVTIHHEVIDKIVEEPVDAKLLENLVVHKMNQHKVDNNLNTIIGKKSLFRQLFINTTVDEWNSDNKQQFTANEIAKGLFDEVISKERIRTNGIRADSFYY